MVDCSGRRWGRGGAGILFLCGADSSLLLLQRAGWVAEGGTWGIPGGGTSGGWESLPILHPITDEKVFLKTALRETEEECGSMPPGFALSQLVKRVEYEHCGFRYITYVCNLTLSQKEAWSLVSEDDETDAFMWFSKSDIEVGELLDGRRIHRSPARKPRPLGRGGSAVSALHFLLDVLCLRP